VKTRRHHNTKGYRQIRRGKCAEQVRKIAKRLKINEELDWHDEALESKADRGFESEVDRDLKQAVAYAKTFDVMLGKIFGA
jgi:hypothetical protein